MNEMVLLLLLFSTGFLAGVSNAVAGGGTFFTFPVFLGAGLPPIVANASNAIAVWPGHALAVVGYRRQLRGHCHGIGKSILMVLAGSMAGALLLTVTGNKVFVKLIPFLILFATVLFAMGPTMAARLSKQDDHSSVIQSGWRSRIFEFAFAFYGGFFGAGLGIMFMALLHLLGVKDIHTNNALKNLLAAMATSIAVLVFAFTGLVAWKYTLIAFSGAVIGGYAGATLAQRLSAKWMRKIVTGFGAFLTVYYFVKYYS